jgi:hypothetical protein
MAFGDKTAWIAVRDRTPEQVADALELTDRRSASFTAGTDAAYKQGVFVTAPIGEWTLAHGRGLFFIDTESPGSVFPVWLTEISRRLGEVQFFSNYRVPEAHMWAAAAKGVVTRAYGWIGDRGEVACFVGEPTAIERELNVGTKTLEAHSDTWDESEWDDFWQTTPNESHVMKVAGRWSVDPTTILDQDVPGDGVFGDFDSKLTAYRR